MVEPRYRHDHDPNSNPRNHGGIWTPWVDDTGDPVPHKPLSPEEKLPGGEGDQNEAAATPVTPVVKAKLVQPHTYTPLHENTPSKPQQQPSTQQDSVVKVARRHPATKTTIVQE